MSVILKGLTPQVFYHPDDLKGLKRLETIPGVKKFIADTISNLREKFRLTRKTLCLPKDH